MGQSLLGFIGFRVGLLLLLIVVFVGEGYAQDQKRTYANFQGNLQHGLKVLGASLIVGEIENAGRAVDLNPKNASTLRIGVGLAGLASSTQFLEFTTGGTNATARTIPANTPVAVKFFLPQSLVGLVDGVSVGFFRDLEAVNADWPLFGLLGPGHNAGHDANYKKELYSGATLLNLLNGAGEVEITLTPNEEYQGIYLKLEGNLLSLALSSTLFHAYILEDATLACDEKDEAIDVLSGVRAGTVAGGIANATGSVTDPWNVIDGNLNTYAQLNTGAAVLSEVFHTVIFQTVSQQNQVAKVVLQGSPSGLGELLDLSLLTGLVIQPYLGTTVVGGPINKATILSLRLLPGSTDKFELAVPVEGSFDRIEIKMGGVLGALESLRIYEVSRLPALPILDGDVVIEKEFDLCEGEKAILTAIAPLGSTLNWYDKQDGGMHLGTMDSLSTGSLSESKTYYVSAKPTGCSIESIRLPIHVNVYPKSGNPNLSISNIND